MIGDATEREAVEHGWTLIERRIEPDHVAVVVSVWPNHSPEQTVRRLQSAMGDAARRLPAARLPRDLWGRGYVATTDIESLEDLVARLLDDQNSEGCGPE